MISLLLLAAHGAPPPAPEHVPVAVDAVVWAQPFTLANPEPWSMARDASDLQQGWLVEVRAPAELLQARAVGQPVLFADTMAAMPLHPPLVASCAVVVVPVAPDSKDLHWYFGSTVLPERIDPDRAAWELAVALDAGIPAQAPETMAPTARYDDLRDLARVAEARFRACRAPAAGPQSL